MSRRSDTRETGMRLRDFVIVATTGGVILLFAKYFYEAAIFGVPILAIEPNSAVALVEAIFLTVLGVGTIIYAGRTCSRE